MTTRVEVADLEENPELGRELEVITLVKWTNQSYHDENLRSMFGGDWDEREDVSKSNAARHRQQYYPGLIARFDLAVDFLDETNALETKAEVQPTDIDIQPSSLALAAGNQIIVRRRLNGPDEQVIANPWFARLHSIERLKNGGFLTASSAFDQIYMLAADGSVENNIDIWAQGRNVNKFGHTLLRALDGQDGPVVINPSIDRLKADNATPGVANLIDDPLAYKGLGLPTYLTPSFVNHVSYDDRKEKILATALNSGECWLIDPGDPRIEVVLRGLSKPHGLISHGEGYIVTDTGRENIMLLDEDFEPRTIYSTASFTDRKPGLEKALWLQNTTRIEDDLLITISAPRQKVTLINLATNEYRDIPFDREWGIQTIKPYPSDVSPT